MVKSNHCTEVGEADSHKNTCSGLARVLVASDEHLSQMSRKW